MKILIVKTSSLGDIVHTFPVIQYLKNKFPKAELDWVVEQPYAPLVKAHPLISSVFSIQTKKWRSSLLAGSTWSDINAACKDLRRKRYDVVFDLQGNIKSGCVTALMQSTKKVGFGRASVPEWPNMLFTNCRYNPPTGQNIREDYLFLVQSFFSDFTHEREKGVCLNISDEEETFIRTFLENPVVSQGMKVVVCPGSNWPNKQLSVDCLAQFLSKMVSRYQSRFLFAWGSEEEKAFVQQLHQRFPLQSIVVPKMSLATLQNVMSHVDLVVAVDSLPLHLAATTATATFSVFGASLADKYKPIGKQHIAFQGTCPYGKTFAKRCSILRTCSTGSCIKDIDGERLFAFFEKNWEQ